jgi:uncharacterized membrane protein YciS (DUF1049 family)
MAIGNAVDNLSELIWVLPPEIAIRMDSLITILKAVGVFAIAYIVYLIVMGMLGFRSRNRVKAIERKVNAIDKKLDNVLKKSKVKKK